MQNQNKNKNQNQNDQNQYGDAFMPLDQSIGPSTGYGRTNTDMMDVSNNTIGNSDFPNNLPGNQQMDPYVNQNQINQINQNQNRNQIDQMSEQQRNLEGIRQNMQNRLPVNTTANQQGPRGGNIFGDNSNIDNSFYDRMRPVVQNNQNTPLDNSLNSLTPGNKRPRQQLVLNPNGQDALINDYRPDFQVVSQDKQAPRPKSKRSRNDYDYANLNKFGKKGGALLPGQKIKQTKLQLNRGETLYGDEDI